jgi:hypothetical protein
MGLSRLVQGSDCQNNQLISLQSTAQLLPFIYSFNNKRVVTSEFSRYVSIRCGTCASMPMDIDQRLTG